MERWEVIFRLFIFCPEINKYRCSVCKKEYKSQNGIWGHIENEHNVEINTIRDEETCRSIF